MRRQFLTIVFTAILAAGLWGRTLAAQEVPQCCKEQKACCQNGKACCPTTKE
jgi:hypothetical protein